MTTNNAVAEYTAKIDILEKKLARKEELLKSAREVSDQRAVKLCSIRERLARLSLSLKKQGIKNEEVVEAMTELNHVAGLDYINGLTS